MFTKADLLEMSPAELQQLKTTVDEAIVEQEQAAKKKALSRIHEVAREFGFKVDELLSPAKPAKTKNPPRFAHPDNKAVTWTGKGRKPHWVEDYLKEGGTMNELRIR